MKIIDHGVVDDPAVSITRLPAAKRLLVRLQKALEATEDAIQGNREARTDPQLQRLTDQIKSAQIQLNEFLQKGAVGEQDSKDLVRLLMRIDRQIEDKLDHVVDTDDDRTVTLRQVLQDYGRRTGKLTLATLDISKQLGRVAGLAGMSIFRLLRSGFSALNFSANDVANTLGQQMLASVAGPLAPLANLVNVGDLLSQGFSALQTGFEKTRDWVEQRKERRLQRAEENRQEEIREQTELATEAIRDELEKTRETLRDTLEQAQMDNSEAIARATEQINAKLEAGDGDIEDDLDRLAQLHNKKLELDQEYYEQQLDDNHKTRLALTESLDDLKDSVGGTKTGIGGGLGTRILGTLKKGFRGLLGLLGINALIKFFRGGKLAKFLSNFKVLVGSLPLIGRLVPEVAALVGAVIGVKAAIDAWRGDAWLYNMIPDKIKTALLDAVEVLVRELDTRWEIATKHWEELKTTTRNIAEKIKEWSDAFPEQLERFQAEIKTAYSNVANLLSMKFDEWSNAVKSIKDQVVSGITGSGWFQKLDHLVETITGGVRWVVDAFKMRWGLLGAVVPEPKVAQPPKPQEPATRPRQTPDLQIKATPQVQRILQKYRAEIQEASKKYGVQEEVIGAMIAQESGGNPKAVSPKGARGLMQLMPGTAKELGVSPDQLFDPRTNILAGTRYFRKMLDLAREYGYTGEEAIAKALEAYNAGPTRVFKQKIIPKESEAYVQRITKDLLHIKPQTLSVEPLEKQVQKDFVGSITDDALRNIQRHKEQIQREKQKVEPQIPPQSQHQPAIPPRADAAGYTRAPYSANETPMYDDDIGVLLINMGMLA